MLSAHRRSCPRRERRVLRERAPGPAADLDGHARHRAAGLGAHRLLRLAGAVSAACIVANAVAAMLQGRLIDGWARHRVLRAGVAIGTAASRCCVGRSRPLAAVPLTYVSAALAGATLPGGRCRGPGPLDARPRAPRRAPDRLRVRGRGRRGRLPGRPVLVTVLATAVDPVRGLVAAIVRGRSAASPSQRSAHRAAGAAAPTVRRRPAADPWRPLHPVAVICCALGVLFGATEVITVAFADVRTGATGVAGGCSRSGRSAAGRRLITGAIAWRPCPATGCGSGRRPGGAMAPLRSSAARSAMGVLLFLAASRSPRP